LREGNRFAPGVSLDGLDGLAQADDSPLRIGR
jgi:hypothetical protein